MAYDPVTTLQAAKNYVANRSGTPDEQAACVAFLAMALTVAISAAPDHDEAEALAIEAGNFVELEARAQPEPL